MTADATALLAADAVDVTLPGRVPERGSLHLIQQTMDEIVDIFVGLGYTVATGPEAETEFYNFTALNIPETHPSRMESDTLYLDYGDQDEEILLRTHTSPMQARYMEEHEPPVYVVVPGRAFRADAVDSTHLPVFHQIEGLAVDENITFGDLKGTLAEFARRFFGRDTKVKFIPHYFPFTEPSAEMHAYTNGQWLELLGCGMVNPAVFEHVGYDPEAVTGFAFGVGAERIADRPELMETDRFFRRIGLHQKLDAEVADLLVVLADLPAVLGDAVPDLPVVVVQPQPRATLGHARHRFARGARLAHWRAR